MIVLEIVELIVCICLIRVIWVRGSVCVVNFILIRVCREVSFLICLLDNLGVLIRFEDDNDKVFSVIRWCIVLRVGVIEILYCLLILCSVSV